MKTQRGLSLVELMVSITIGLFLLLGLGTIFVSINQTSRLRQGLSALQNNERMAMTFLETSIHNAGYYPDPVSGVAPANPLSGTGTGMGTDTLSVQFVAASGVSASQGCTAQLNAGDSYTDTFSVTGGNLTCIENDYGPIAGTSAVPAVTNVNLITGLSGMNVLYGVDPACTGSVTKYVKAAGVTGGVCTTPLGSELKAVNVTLLFTNPLAGQPGQAATISVTQTTPYMNGL